MSRRPPRAPQSALGGGGGGGMFKNLFEVKPEFPLSDGHPPQRKPLHADIGVPFTVQGVPSFEIVATFQPYESISDEDKAILEDQNGGRNRVNGGRNRGMRQEVEILLDQFLLDQEMPDAFADSAVVLKLRLRRIVDAEHRIGMAIVIRKLVDQKLMPFFNEVWPKIKYASHSAESTCSPILSEYSMMWCSTDMDSSDRFTKLLLGNARDGRRPNTLIYNNPSETFFRIVFGEVGADVNIDPDEEATTYKSAVSMQTKWSFGKSFILPRVFQDGRVSRDKTDEPTEAFAARQFEAVAGQRAAGQRAAGQRQRLR